MPDYVDLQGYFETGRGKAAEIFGVPADIYRLNDSSSGSYLDIENKIATATDLYFKGATAKELKSDLETDVRLGSSWYVLIADLSLYQVGDIFLIQDPVFGAGHTAVPWQTSQYRGFALAQHGETKKSFAARLNTTVKISRPECDPDTGNYFPSGTGGDQVLLSNGQFTFGSTTDEGTAIPVGLYASGRTYGSKTFSDVPSDQPKSSWFCYVPPLQGFSFREGDQLTAADGAIYRVLIPYSQDVGACGSQLFLERESAGTAPS